MHFIHISSRRHTWATMIELMAVLAVMWLGISALLQTIWWGLNYARDTENNIKAINIAREWIEWMINIRDTNWLRFSSDRVNCWRTAGYDVTCIGNINNSNGNVINTNINSWSYILYPQNGVWRLFPQTTLDPVGNWAGYKNIFKVWLDSGWNFWGFYTQTGVSTIPCSSYLQKDCLTIFTREVTVVVPLGQTGSIDISSIVRWFDRRPQSVILYSTLTNWKSNF